MDLNSFLTITFITLISSGIGYWFYAFHRLKNLQNEIQEIASLMREELKKINK